MSTDLYKLVTDQIIEQMESSGSNWVKDWAGNASGLPTNISSKNHYQGINVLLLGFSANKQGFASSDWGTYKQWAEKGGQVTKGSKSTMGIFFRNIEVADRNAEGETTLIPMLRKFHLFNADQVDGIEKTSNHLHEHQPIEEGQHIIDSAGVDIITGQPAYIPAIDSISMPDLNAFNDAEGYYLTAFHELTHWTGNKKRLGRDMGKRFGDSAYAMEELVAEIGAAYLGAVSGMTPQPREDHSKYLNHWLKVLKADKRAIFTAASKAQQATNFITELAA